MCWLIYAILRGNNATDCICAYAIMALRKCHKYNYLLWYCVYAINTMISYDIVYMPYIQLSLLVLRICHTRSAVAQW